MLAIYFQAKTEQSESQLRTLDMHARLAADCLERISAQSALRQSELLNRQIIDNIPDCIFVLDVTLDRRFKFAELNPAEQKAVGLSTAEVSGKLIEVYYRKMLPKTSPRINVWRLVRQSATKVN